MTTALEEYHQRMRESLTEKAKGDGPDAAYARLALRVGVLGVSEWLMEEMKRGTNGRDLHDAFATVAGNLTVNFISGAPDPIFSANYIAASVAAYIQAQISGQSQCTGIEIDHQTGHQREATVSGLFAERLAAARRQP